MAMDYMDLIVMVQLKRNVSLKFRISELFVPSYLLLMEVLGNNY